MKRNIILIFMAFELFSVRVIFADDDKPLTKGDFKLFVKMIDKRFEAVDRRFEDMNKRFDMIFWFMGIGFPALALFSLFLFRVTNKRMDERFEQVNKRMDERFEAVDRRFEEINERFEQVNALLLLLVKVHEKEIGSQAFDVAMGRLKMKDITREMVEDIEKRSVLQNQDLIDEIINKLQPIMEEKMNGKFRSLVSELKKDM